MDETVWMVGYSDAESSSTVSVHLTRDGALKAFHEVRQQLIDEAQDQLAYCQKAGFGVEMYETMIRNLRCDDPTLINNYPHNTPWISQMPVQP